jgi:hypothetical protein
LSYNPWLTLHISYFESLEIPTPASQDSGKARIWPVLSRNKEERNQILVYTRNQAPPNLPLSIRVIGPPGERWTQDSARKDLILWLEAELEEKVLRYKLAIKDNLHLEWCWNAEPGRGGMECTILAHIHTGSSALSVQNKRHLHWKEAESISVMNNDMGGAVVAHNLLLKKDLACSDHLAHKQRMASILASPQAARKKRFVKLDWGNLEADLPGGTSPAAHPTPPGRTTHHNPGSNQEIEGLGGLTFSPGPSFPPSEPAGGLSYHNTGPTQGRNMGSIGHQTAQGYPYHV